MTRRIPLRPRRLHSQLGVAENKWLLARAAAVETRIMEMQGHWIALTDSTEAKLELGQCLYEDALHVDALRRRVQALVSDREVDRPLDGDDLDAFCNEVTNAPTLALHLTGLFRVLKPKLLEHYEWHLASTDDVTDGPTSRILRQIIPEEREHIAWGEAALAVLLEDPAVQAEAASWQAHLEEQWRRIGGIRGEKPADVPSPAFVHPERPAPNLERLPVRDDRFQVVSFTDYDPLLAPVPPGTEVMHAMHSLTSAELEAVENLGRIIADFPDLPWEIRLDLARQLWDETRHCEADWRRVEEMGGVLPLCPVTAWTYEHSGVSMDPLDRLIVLQRVAESRAIDVARVRIEHIALPQGDLKSVRIWDYMSSDETAHVRYSHWIDDLTANDPARRARLLARQREMELELEKLFATRNDSKAMGVAVALD